MCSGNMFGEYAKDDKVQSSMPHNEDVEKQLKHAVVYGGLLRLNDVGCKQKFFSEGGVVQFYGGLDNRMVAYHQSVKELVQKYPGLISIKKGGSSLERLKVITVQRYPSLLAKTAES